MLHPRIKHVATHLSRLAVLWLVEWVIETHWNVDRSPNTICNIILYSHHLCIYNWTKVIILIRDPFQSILIFHSIFFRHVRIAIAFLVVPFIPSSNLVTVGFVLADRVLYIPSIGYCLLIAFGTQAILPLSPKIIRCVIVLLLLLFMMRSNERSIDWQNNLQLFKSAVRVCPNNAKIYYNLGQISAAKGNQNKSLEYNLIANELQPNTISTLINLGNAYRHLGHTQNAIEFHKRVTNLEWVFTDYFHFFINFHFHWIHQIRVYSRFLGQSIRWAGWIWEYHTLKMDHSLKHCTLI